MTYREFLEMSRFAIATLDDEEIDYAWYCIDKNHNYKLPSVVEADLYAAIYDWCDDHEIDPDEWTEQWDIIDVWCDGQMNDAELRNCKQLKESYTRYPEYRKQNRSRF